MNDETTAIVIGEAAPAEVVPVLWDGPDLDLPDNAVLNADGSVTVLFAYPFDLAYRAPGGDQVTRTERVETVTLHRLTGADVVKITKARDSERAAMVASARMTPAKFELWSQKMDAADESTIGRVVTELMAVGRAGLPDQAKNDGSGVTLRLLFPTSDDEGGNWDEMRFPRMTAAQRRGMREAEEPLAWAVRHATGLSPKSATNLLHRMDAADAAAITRVISFLS